MFVNQNADAYSDDARDKWVFRHVRNEKNTDINLDQFVMPTTERGQDADNYIRELRDNDRI